MKIFITGASGFISSYMIPHLLEQGHEVVAFDIAPISVHLKPFASEITYIRGDLSDGVSVYKAIALTRPTHVLHLGSILAGPCEQNPSRGFSINFESTMNLLEASVDFGVERFVMTSSISVFGRGLDEPVSDDAVKQPETIYGQTKLACEHLLRWYADKKQLSTGAVRFPWVFGPGRSTGITALWSSKLLDQVAAGEHLVIENPEERGDWLYVKDAVKALMMMLEHTATPSVCYNIMGSNHTIREAMEIVKTVEPEADIVFKPKETSASPYPASYSDEKARREIHWNPDFLLAEAAADHIKLYRDREQKH